MRLSNDIGVHVRRKKRPEGLAASSRTHQIVAGDQAEIHSTTTSPGFQSGLRSQYS